MGVGHRLASYLAIILIILSAHAIDHLAHFGFRPTLAVLVSVYAAFFVMRWGIRRLRAVSQSRAKRYQ
jgi:hypothetical protein